MSLPFALKRAQRVFSSPFVPKLHAFRAPLFDASVVQGQMLTESRGGARDTNDPVRQYLGIGVDDVRSKDGSRYMRVFRRFLTCLQDAEDQLYEQHGHALVVLTGYLTRTAEQPLHGNVPPAERTRHSTGMAAEVRTTEADPGLLGTRRTVSALVDACGRAANEEKLALVVGLRADSIYLDLRPRRGIPGNCQQQHKQ